MFSLPVRALLCGVAEAALVGCTTDRGAQTGRWRGSGGGTPADMKNAQDAQAQEITRLAGDVKAMDAQQAFLMAEIKNLSEQNAKLNKAMDAQQAFVVAEIKNLSEQNAKLHALLSEAEGAVRSLRATVVSPETRPPSPVVPPPAQALAPEPIPAPAPSPAAPAAPPSSKVEADRMFATALAKLRAGEDGQAALEFTEFVAQFSGHPQAAAAQNHIGDAYYRQRDFRQAMGEFQKTVDGYMQPAQVSEALLKIGLCHLALGDAERAKAYWERVVKQFPKNDAARKARTLLTSRAAAGR